MEKELQIERFENAIRVLESIPPEKEEGFDMSTFGRPDYDVVCGTVRCAAGHMGSDPWFIERGFFLIEQMEWLEHD